MFSLALALAALFIVEMYGVLSVGRLTLLKIIMLIFFVINISWISHSFANAVIGFLALCAGRPSPLADAAEGTLPTARTAILIPAYNEDPARVMATALATAQGLAEEGVEEFFDIFVLSDSNDPDIWIAEEACYRAATAPPAPRARIYYRHRRHNTDRKAGNIADWVQRFGRAYPHFVVFDADSLMAPQTLIRMAVAMEKHPELGLLQTFPVIVGRNTLFARVQQFAARVYGPVMAAGLAAWTRDSGNYWGHNAILRTKAFAESAGLPHLRGRPPFGGHILSHDFVEAALMRRAGWQVVIDPTLGGSYEESPPSLIDLAQRDRRWCQGNLQHAKLIGGKGFDWVSRVHFGIGIMSYLASPAWLIFLIAGLLLALQAHYVRPEYFTQELQLFPSWPVIDYQRAIGLFMGTMTLLFVPKLLGLVTTLLDARLRRGAGGIGRASFSVILESLFSALVAPVMMLFQSLAVMNILVGRDAGWHPQRREDGTMPLMEIVCRHRLHTLFGVVLGIAAYLVSPYLLAWMSPAVLGLVLAIPLSVLTASRGAGLWLRRFRLLIIPEEVEQPPILRRACAAADTLAGTAAGSGCARLLEDPTLLAFHRKNLGIARASAPDEVQPDLVVGLARLDASFTIEEAFSSLSRSEKQAVLGDPAGLDRIARLPRAASAA